MRKVSFLDNLYRRAVVLSSVLMLSLAPIADAQDAAAKEAAAESKDEVKKQTSVFDVPDEATAAELLAHTTKIKRARPGSGEAKGWLEKQVTAVIACCDKALELKPEGELEVRVFKEKLGALGVMARFDADGSKAMKAELMELAEASSNSGVTRMLTTTRLQEKAFQVRQMSDDDKAAYLDEVFATISPSGISMTDYTFIRSLASRVTRSAPKVATEMSERLAQTLESSDDEKMAGLAKRMRLEIRIPKFGEMLTDEQTAFVEEIFGSVTPSEFATADYQLINGFASSISRGNPEIAGEVYGRLADLMEGSDSAQLVARAEKTRGAARRVNLPGNFMEIVGKTAEGEDFDWASYRGKVVLVDFWASWCGPCRGEIPNMKQQLENYGAKGFDIVGVNLDNTRAAYQKYVDEQELTWTNLMSDKKEEMGWNNPLVTHYGVSGIPTAILVDQEGKVVSMSARGSRLNKLLEDLLGPVEEEPKETPDATKDATE